MPDDVWPSAATDERCAQAHNALRGRRYLDRVPALHDRFRMDFHVQILETDEESGLMKFALRPDPDRYEWIEDGQGGRALLDRFDGNIIPEHVIAEAARNMAGMPTTFAPPLINDALAYVDSRGEVIEGMLAGEGPAPDLADPSADLLTELADLDLDFAIISVDLVGSTKLATSIARPDYVRLVQTLQWELAEVAPLFHGHVLKYTGDGVIVFIPGPSSNQQNDLAIDCALTMRGVVYRALNPALKRAGLPTVQIRIGIDAGEASVVVLGSPATKRHADIIGDVVSLACKIERSARAGDIQVGGIAARAMHVHWREILELAPVPARWSYTDEWGEPYPVYRVRRVLPPSNQP